MLRVGYTPSSSSEHRVQPEPASSIYQVVFLDSPPSPTHASGPPHATPPYIPCTPHARVVTTSRNLLHTPTLTSPRPLAARTLSLSIAGRTDHGRPKNERRDILLYISCLSYPAHPLFLSFFAPHCIVPIPHPNPNNQMFYIFLLSFLLFFCFRFLCAILAPGFLFLSRLNVYIAMKHTNHTSPTYYICTTR